MVVDLEEYRATIVWKCVGDFSANTYSRAHSWKFDGGIDVPASSSPGIVPLPQSNAEAVDPEEAFVASVSSCHMLWFLDLARRDGYEVSAYVDEAMGSMEAIGKTARGMTKFAITKIVLSPRITFVGVPPSDDVHQRLHSDAHDACFIANSVKTEIVTSPTIA
ncbi:MAG: OsmC family protein [Pseudomonadota bacterium]